jgi:hypothetical protein
MNYAIDREQIVKIVSDGRRKDRFGDDGAGEHHADLLAERRR